METSKTKQSLTMGVWLLQLHVYEYVLTLSL